VTANSLLSLDRIRIDGGTPDTGRYGRYAYLARFTPQHLFEEYTGLDDEASKAIRNICWDKDAIAFIDWHPRLELFVFHSLSIGDTIWKKPIAADFQEEKERGKEAVIEDALCAILESAGRHFRRQFRTRAGIIDVLTDGGIYELKKSFARVSVFEAVGQLMLYSTTVHKGRTKVIVAGGRVPYAFREPLSSNGIMTISFPFVGLDGSTLP
jgi:hypothetical protein